MITSDGLLRELAPDRRALDPARYGHVRHELGLEVAAEEVAAGQCQDG